MHPEKAASTPRSAGWIALALLAATIVAVAMWTHPPPAARVASAPEEAPIAIAHRFTASTSATLIHERSPSPSPRLLIQVVDSRSGEAIASASVVSAELRRRIYSPRDVTILASTDSSGSCEVDRARLGCGSKDFVTAAGYASRELPAVHPDRSALTVALDPGERFVANCVDDASGTPVAGVFVALSRLNVNHFSFAESPGVGDGELVADVDPDASIRSASSGADGRLRVDGLTAGRYWAYVTHASHSVVSGLESTHAVDVPGEVEFRLRPLHGVVVLVKGANVLGVGRHPDRRAVVSDDPSPVLQSAFTMMEVGRRHAGCGVYVCLPRPEHAERGVEVGFAFALDNGTILRHRTRTRPLGSGLIPEIIDALPGMPCGELTLEMTDVRGRRYVGVPVEVLRDELRIVGVTGTPLRLPAGGYAVRVGGWGSPKLSAEVGEMWFNVDAADRVMERIVLAHRYTRCTIDPVFPYEDRGTGLAVRLEDDDRVANLYNWHPSREPDPFYLTPGAHRLRIGAVGLWSGDLTIEVPDDESSHAITVPLTARALR